MRIGWGCMLCGAKADLNDVQTLKAVNDAHVCDEQAVELTRLRAERDQARSDADSRGRALLQARETLNGASNTCPRHGDTFPSVMFGCDGCHQAAAVRNTRLAIAKLMDDDTEEGEDL